MPYIAPEQRNRFAYLDSELENLCKYDKLSAGEMQYIIALMIKHSRPENYQDMNDVMGALAGAQMEFYRQTVAPYEDTKIKLNGEV
jgi:hypothetical protein